MSEVEVKSIDNCGLEVCELYKFENREDAIAFLQVVQTSINVIRAELNI